MRETKTSTGKCSVPVMFLFVCPIVCIVCKVQNYVHSQRVINVLCFRIQGFTTVGKMLSGGDTGDDNNGDDVIGGGETAR